MLGFILALLKVIGCIILVLLAVIVLLLLIVLFVPVRYNVSGTKNGAFRVAAEASWLLKLIKASVLFDTDKRVDRKLKIKARAAFITLYDNAKEDKKENDVAETSVPEAKSEFVVISEKDSEAESSVKSDELPEKPSEEINSGEGREDPVFKADKKEQKKEEKDIKTDKDQKKKADKGNKKSDDKSGKPDKKKPVKDKSSGKKGKSNHASTVSSVPDKSRLEILEEKVNKLKCRKKKIQRVIDNEKNQIWFRKLLCRLKKLILYLVPNIRKLYLHFGFKDPSMTGKVLGGLSMLYPVVRESMDLRPEFEKEILEGEFEIYGRIRLIRFAAFTVPTFLNPRFFKIFKQVRKALR